MYDKKKIKNYIKHYRRLLKSGMHGAAGFAETEPDRFSELEIAVRYLIVRHGAPIIISTELYEGKRQCYVTIKNRGTETL